MFGEQILRMVAGLFVGVWVARYLGPEQFGIFSYALAFVSVFSSIAKLGLDSIIIRDLVMHPDKKNEYLGTAFWLKCIGAVFMILILVISLFLMHHDLKTDIYILVIGAGIIFQGFEVIDFYFQSQVLSRFVSICKLTQLLLSSVLKLYLISINADLFLFVLVTLIDQLTLSLALITSYKYQKAGGFWGNFSFLIAKKLLKDGWPFLLSSLAILVYMRIDQIMIKEMINDQAVGLYSAAIRVSEVWYFVPVIITNSLFPSIVSAKRNSEVLYYRRLQMLYTFLVWISLSIAIFITFAGSRLIVFLYGLPFEAASNVLTIHIWTGIFVALGVAQSKFWIANNLQDKAMIITIFSCLLNGLLNYILIPRYGIQGSAFATLISYFVGSLVLPLFIEEARGMVLLSYKAFMLRIN